MMLGTIREMERRSTKTIDERWTAFFPWKALLYPGKIQGILEGKFEAPVILHVYPTNECNSDCLWCIMREERARGGQLERDVFERLIDDANEMGVRAIHVSGGGEPLLYNHLDLLDRFKGTRILSTNGTRVGSYGAKWLWSLFDRIRVSLDAGSPDVYFAVRREHRFEEVLRGIQELGYEKARLREAGLSDKGFVLDRYRKTRKSLGLGFVLDAENWKSIFDFCLLPERYHLNVDFLHVRPAYYPRSSPGDVNTRRTLDPAFLLCEAARAATRVPIFSISEKFRGYWTDRSFEKCLATPLHAVVTATGEFIVCQDVFIRFGNLNQLTFPEIWGSDEHKSAIARIQVDGCPRCVMTTANEMIENVFLKDRIIPELI